MKLMLLSVSEMDNNSYKEQVHITMFHYFSVLQLIVAHQISGNEFFKRVMMHPYRCQTCPSLYVSLSKDRNAQREKQFVGLVWLTLSFA